ATRAAVEEGILPGGGVALLRASMNLKASGLSSDEEVGYNIVVRACESPIRQIAENAGTDGAIVSAKVRENSNTSYGYDARLNKYCDMVKEGIIDPTKVVRSALQNAQSVATLLLTSDALVAEMPKDEQKTPGGHGGGEERYYHAVIYRFAQFLHAHEVNLVGVFLSMAHALYRAMLPQRRIRRILALGSERRRATWELEVRHADPSLD